jgi:hypothetical protein
LTVRLGVLTLFSGVDLCAVHADGARGSNAEAHLVAVDAEHRDGNVGADLKGFCRAAGEDQHRIRSLMFSFGQASLECRGGAEGDRGLSPPIRLDLDQ